MPNNYLICPQCGGEFHEDRFEHRASHKGVTSELATEKEPVWVIPKGFFDYKQQTDYTHSDRYLISKMMDRITILEKDVEWQKHINTQLRNTLDLHAKEFRKIKRELPL